MIFLECFVWICLMIIVNTLFSILSFVLKKTETLPYNESISTYECGFDSFLGTLSGFCIQFFNISLLYLLIDLEIALIVPFFLKIFLFSSIALILSFLLIILFFLLIFLLIIEYKMGGFDCWDEVFSS